MPFNALTMIFILVRYAKPVSITRLLQAFPGCGDYIIQPLIGEVFTQHFEATWPLNYSRYPFTMIMDAFV